METYTQQVFHHYCQRNLVNHHKHNLCLYNASYCDTQIPWRDCYKLKQHEKTFAGIHDSKNGNNKGNSKKK